MANHKDALKRARQSKKQRLLNRAYRAEMRNKVKNLRSIVETGSAEEAETAFRTVQGLLQSYAQRHLIHHNTADRSISRLAAAVKGKQSQA